MSTAEEGEKSKPEIHFPEGGKFDADGFWIMPEGDFYDPDGIHFSKDGVDQFGGYYDQQGQYYFPASGDNQEESKQGKAIGHKKHKVFFPLIEGAKFNQAGFYELQSGAFYDPLGNYFDEKGYDAVGGFYNELGEYQEGDVEFNDEDEDQQKYQNLQEQYIKQYEQVDPNIVQQQKLEIDQQIQQTHDQALENPGLSGKYIKKDAPPQVEAQEKDSEQDDEEGVVVQKLTLKKEQKESPGEKKQE